MCVRKGKRFTVKVNKKKLCFSKWLVIFFTCIYLEIVVYTQVAMWYFRNISALEYLLVNVLPPTITIIGYFIKAGFENRKGGIVYETALKNLDVEEENDE